MTRLQFPNIDPKALKPLFDAILAPMMIIDVMPDKSLRYGLFNLAAEEYYSLSDADYRGKPVRPYMGKDEARRVRREKTIAAYNQCVTSGETVSLDMDHVRSNSEERFGQHHIAPIIQDGVVSKLMVTSVDVTELVRTRQRLSDALTRTLSDYMTICASCKDVKSDDGWVSIEEYASRKMQFSNFSHGLCPQYHDRELKKLNEESDST